MSLQSKNRWFGLEDHLLACARTNGNRIGDFTTAAAAQHCRVMR